MAELLDPPAAPLTAVLAALGLIVCLAALAIALFLTLRAARRLGKDEFAGLYGTYYGYRAALNPDPLLPLPLGVELDILPSPWRRYPRAVWHNPSLPAYSTVVGRAYRNAEGFTVVLDEGANLPFLIVLLDLARLGMPDIKLGIQSGMLSTRKHPYAATVLFSRRPLDQRAAAEALKRFGAFGITIDEAKAIAEQALAGPSAASQLGRGKPASNGVKPVR